MMMLRRILWKSMMNRKTINADVAEDEVEVDDVEGHEVKEEEDDDVEDDHVEAKRRDPHFVRACALEMHINMSQCHKSHLIKKLLEKCRGPEPRRRLCASLRGRNAHEHVARATSGGHLQGKCRGTQIPGTECPGAWHRSMSGPVR